VGSRRCTPISNEIITHIGTLAFPFMLLSNGRWAEPERLLNFLKQIPALDGC